MHSKATDIKQWPLLYRAPIPTWTKGKVVLAGDAAHPMLPRELPPARSLLCHHHPVLNEARPRPDQGQGGAQAIEDGVALGIALCGVTDGAQIPGRIAAWETIRRVRGSVVQVFSNAGQDEAELVQREAAKFISLAQVPRASFTSSARPCPARSSLVLIGGCAGA